MTRPEYPSNAKNSKPASEPRKIETVVTSEVKSRPKSVGRRLKESLIGGDSQTAISYVVHEIVIPQAKEMISEAVSQAFERFIFGDGRSSGRRHSSRSTGYTNYARYSSTRVRRGDREERETVSVRTNDLDDLIFKTRVEAQSVLEQMVEVLEEYEMITIADLYSMINWTKKSTHTDQNWGWESLEGATIRMVRGGYALILPKAVFLD